MTGRPKAANRAGSPLAFRISPSHCGASRAITRSRMVLPAMVRIGLSPPPIRRASPPASSTPGMSGAPLGVAGAPFAIASVVTALALALVPRGFFFDVIVVLFVDDALFARQRNEALSARAPDQRQPDLASEVDTPRREARARDENGDSHSHRLDHHLGGEPSRGVENF